MPKLKLSIVSIRPLIKYSAGFSGEMAAISSLKHSKSGSH